MVSAPFRSIGNVIWKAMPLELIPPTPDEVAKAQATARESFKARAFESAPAADKRLAAEVKSATPGTKVKWGGLKAMGDLKRSPILKGIGGMANFLDLGQVGGVGNKGPLGGVGSASGQGAGGSAWRHPIDALRRIRAGKEVGGLGLFGAEAGRQNLTPQTPGAAVGSGAVAVFSGEAGDELD